MRRRESGEGEGRRSGGGRERGSEEVGERERERGGGEDGRRKERRGDRNGGEGRREYKVGEM